MRAYRYYLLYISLIPGVLQVQIMVCKVWDKEFVS